MKLQHLNVLRLFGACSINANPPWFFVCPYYGNGSLVYYLRKLDLPPSPEELLIMVQQIADGMKYLHMKGIVHGDLKVCVYILPK